MTGLGRDERARGCLFGGAVGDALGAAVEFDSIHRIRERFGARGVTGFEVAYGRRGAITDDTQMTIFTTEGLMRAYVRGSLKGIVHVPSMVDLAYAHWLATQGERSVRWPGVRAADWLRSIEGMNSRRAPGNTCLSALRAERRGTVAEPLNDSKGCGAVMRAAPVGLFGCMWSGDLFELGCDIAALTHGHPSGYLAAGALTEIIDAIANDGAPLDEALDRATARVRESPRHEETLAALESARRLAARGAAPSPETVASLGAGWVAEEALAISVYCALVARDFEHGALLAVNHSGDSDSTGAITGNILGAIGGVDSIPPRWVHDIELRDVLERLCDDWITLLLSDPRPDLEDPSGWGQRYPGW